jgi:hypothetical protein
MDLFELSYIEDIYRFSGVLFSKNIKYNNTILSENTYKNIIALLNLKSSRCIATCMYIHKELDCVLSNSLCTHKILYTK